MESDSDKMEDHLNLEQQIAKILVEHGHTLATAESCTGGLLGHRLTEMPGSSQYYLGGVIAYSNEAKMKFLGVQANTLEREGAVSAAVAEEMVRGAQEAFQADYALAITGIAGPDGGTDEKPVGLTFIALATPQGIKQERFIWTGKRSENKSMSASIAFKMLFEEIQPLVEYEVEASFNAAGQARPLSVVVGGEQRPVISIGRRWSNNLGDFVLVRVSGGYSLEITLQNGTWFGRVVSQLPMYS